MTKYSYLIVRTGTFKYFQQDRKKLENSPEKFWKFIWEHYFQENMDRIPKTVTDYPSVRIYSIPEGNLT